MGLSINTNVKGASQVTTLAEAFKKMADALVHTAKVTGEFTAQQKGMFDWLNRMAASGGKYTEVLDKQGKALREMSGETRKAQQEMAKLDGMKMIKGPFREMTSDASKLRVELLEVNKAIKETNASNAGKVNNKALTEMVVQTRAALLLEKQIEPELQKQAVLYAKIAAIRGSDKNTAVSGGAANMKTLTEDTKRLTSELERLTAAENKATIATNGLTASYGKAVAGTGQASASVGALLGQTQKAATSMQSLTGAYNKVVVGTGKANSGISTMLGNTEKVDAATRKLAGSNAYLAGSYDKAVVGSGKTAQSHVTLAGAADKARLAQEKLARTNANLGAGAGGTPVVGSGSGSSVNAALLGKSAIPKTTAEMKKLDAETKNVTASTNKLEKAQVDWGKSAKYAIGGVARSLGAMTYSYAMLGPLMAGMAAGGAIKKVYELGTAFEYTTTYVDALADSMSKMNQTTISSELLDIEGLRKGPQELAEGMKEFAKAGDDASMSLEHIAEMSKFATIAEIGLADASKLVIGQTKAFGNSYSETANMISAASLSSATSIEEMGSAMSYTTELATVSKISFDEVATAMAIMANAGIRGSKAGTALRTSVLKMQAPSTKLRKELDALGISWSAFTEDGQVKNLRTMFTELKKATDQLPDAQRITILKELFGLRALKGGANVLNSMGKTWDDLNSKIQGSTEGVSYIEQTYEKLGDTVTAKLEMMGATWEKVLIQAFDSQAVKDMLDTLTQIISSDFTSSSLESVVDSVNALATGIGALISLASTIPVDIVEWGLIGLIVFGKNPITKGIAGTQLIYQELQKLVALMANVPDVDQLSISEMFGGVDEAKQAEREIMQVQGMMESLKLTLFYTHAGIEELFTDNKTPQKIKEHNDALVESLQPKNLDEALAAARRLGDIGKELAIMEEMSGVNEMTDLKLQLKIALETDEKPIVADIKRRINALQYKVDEDHILRVKMELDKKIFTPETLTPIGEAMKDLMDGLDYKQQVSGATAWEKKLLAVKKQVEDINDAMMKEEETSSGMSQKNKDLLEAKMILGLLQDQTRDLDEKIQDIDFNNMVQSLENADTATGDLAASLAKAKKKAFDAIESMTGFTGTWNNVTFQDAQVEEYYNKIISGAMNAEGAIKKMNDEVKKTNEEIADMEFDLELNMMTDEGKTRAISAKADELVRLSRQAGEAGLDGREREVELLTKARDLVLQMNTSGKAVTKDQAQAAYDKYADRYQSVRGGVQKNDPEMLKLKQESDRLAKLYYANEADPKAEKAAQQAQLDKVKAINDKIQASQKARLEEASEIITGTGEDFTEQMRTAGEVFREAALGGGTGSDGPKAPTAATQDGMCDAAAEAAKVTGKAVGEVQAAQALVNGEKVKGLEISKQQLALEAQAADEARRRASGTNQQIPGSGVVGITDPGTDPSVGMETANGMVIMLENVGEAAQKAYDGMRGLFDTMPEGRESFQEFTSAVSDANTALGVEKDLEYIFGDIDSATKDLVDGAKKASEKVETELDKVSPEPVDPEIFTPLMEKAKQVKVALEDMGTGQVADEDLLAPYVEMFQELMANDKAYAESVGETTEKINDQVTELDDVEEASKDAMETLRRGSADARDDIDMLVVSLDKAATAASKIKLPTGSAEPRALGGPVTAGNTYMVGEVGPELFTPKSSGYIVPNDQLTGSAVSKDTVNINLAINGSEPIELQGSQQSVDQLQKAFDKQRRYAG